MSHLAADALDRMKAIRLVAMDVDGVLTDGGILLGTGEVELKRFDVRDGTGIKYLHRAGLATALITGRTSAVVARRAEELGITEVHQGALVKMEVFRALLARRGLRPEEVAYIGDDLPDLPVLRAAGLAAAVADAHPLVRAAAHVVTCAPGGRGAVRELAELLLKAQGRWQEILSRYL